jgi:hypothetical protein
MRSGWPIIRKMIRRPFKSKIKRRTGLTREAMLVIILMIKVMKSRIH